MVVDLKLSIKIFLKHNFPKEKIMTHTNTKLTCQNCIYLMDFKNRKMLKQIQKAFEKLGVSKQC